MKERGGKCGEEGMGVFDIIFEDRGRKEEENWWDAWR